MNELMILAGVVIIVIGLVVVLYGFSIPEISTDYKPTTDELTYDPMPLVTPTPAPSNASSIDEIADSIDTKDKVIEEVIPE